MNTVFKLMLFSIMINFATGIMMTVVVDANGNPVFDPANRMGLDYAENYTFQFTSEMNNTIQPTGDLEDKGNMMYRILDKLNLGFISKFLQLVDRYMFGFVQILDNIFGGILGETLRSMIFGMIRILITVGYVMGALALWTGREVDVS